MRPPTLPHVSRIQVLIGVYSPWTRDHRHMKVVVPRMWNKIRPSFKLPKFKDVKPKDRIKWWNIVPGDRVRVSGDPDGAIHEVKAINKYSNRVYLNMQNDNEADTDTARSRNVHYSRCQLLVGRFQFPPSQGSTEPETLPVFATRIATSEPHWHPPAHRFDWTRFAAATSPRLPDWSKGTQTRIPISWPMERRPRSPDPTIYDTTEDAVAELTYRPPTLPLDPKEFSTATASVPSEQEYIKSLTKRSAFDPAAPVEIYVHRELTNPHSRAKKQERWQARQLYKRSLLRHMVREEYKNLNGRTKRDARADATWKCRNRLIEERKAEVKRRWVNRGAEANLLNRRARRAKKAERLQKKLRNLTLDEAPNQAVPGRKTT